MKANNGNEVSAPLNPNMCSKTSWHAPSVAKNDKTTVPKRSAADKILRRRSPRIKVIRTKTIGMIVRLSRFADTSVSNATAVLPPTRIFGSIA